MEDLAPLTSGPAPSSLTSSPVSPSPNPPFLVILTVDPPCPAVPALAPSVSYTPPSNVSFGTGIAEDLPYEFMAKAPYPPPAISKLYDLAATARATAEDIFQALSLQDFIASKQRGTLGALLEAVLHPAATLLQYYVE